MPKSPKQRTLAVNPTDGHLRLGSPIAKRHMPAFQYKSILTVAKKTITIMSKFGIKVTTFIECPLPPGVEGSATRPPSILVASPVPGEEFPRYFNEVLMPGALAIARDTRYHTAQVMQRVEEIQKARDEDPATGEVQVETLFVSPETFPYTQRGPEGQHPILITPYHRLANI